MPAAVVAPSAVPPQRVFRRLLGLLRPQRGMIAVALLVLLCSMPAELFPAFVWMYAADHLVTQQTSPTIDVLHVLFSFGGRLTEWPSLLISSLVWLMVIYVIGETLETLSSNLMQRVAQRFILKLRNDVYHKLQGQSLNYLQKQRTGDLMSRALSDVDELQSFVVQGIDVILGEGLLWVITVVTVMLVDWRVASVSIAPLIAVYFLLRLFNRRIAPIYKEARERAGDVSTRLQENLSGVVVIKIFGRERDEAERFRDATRASYAAQVRAINARSLFFPFSRAVGFLSNVAMIGMGAWLILTNQGFTLGKMLMFRAYWWRLFGPINTLARVNDMVQRARAAGRRVFEVLDAPDELPDAADAVSLEHVRGEIELKNVTFAYGRGEPQRAQRTQREEEKDRSANPVGQAQSPVANSSSASPSVSSVPSVVTYSPTVLHDVSLSIRPGQTVALCGPSGSGKTTILSLLVRFYDPDAGTITIDGHDLRAIQRDSLRGHFALVQQETFLFNESIADNIRYGRRDATMDDVIAAAKAANAHGFISRLPQGYDSVAGERGVKLSGGQKQRISIARAFLANPSILLLDEPTSSVEPDSEAAIIAALDRLMTDRTTVITSHRPALIGQADVVYVIRDGRLVDSGSVDDVRSRDAWFARFMGGAEEGEEART